MIVLRKLGGHLSIPLYLSTTPVGSMSSLHPSPCAGDNVLHRLVSYEFDSDHTLRSAIQRKPHLLNSPNEDGETPLFYAVRCAYFQGIRYLLSGGANVLSVDRYNRTPLHYAAMLPEYSGDIIQLLCRDGDTSADVAMDLEGRVPLHLATIVGNSGGVQELLSWGAFVDTVAGDSGETALHMAAAEGHTDIAKMLLMAGALRGAVGYKGLTPYAIARRAGWRALADLLEPPLSAPSSRGEASGSGGGSHSRMPASYASPSPPGLRREQSSSSSSSSSHLLNPPQGAGLAPIIPPPHLPPPPPPPFSSSSSHFSSSQSSSGRGTPPGYRSSGGGGGGGSGYRSPTSPLLRSSPSPHPDTPNSYHPPPPPFPLPTSAASRLGGGGGGGGGGGRNTSPLPTTFPRPPRTPPPSIPTMTTGPSWKTDTEGETDGGYATPKSTGGSVSGGGGGGGGRPHSSAGVRHHHHHAKPSPSASASASASPYNAAAWDDAASYASGPEGGGAASHHSFVSALGDTTEDDRDGGGGGGDGRMRRASGSGSGGLVVVGALQRDLSEARSRVSYLEGQVRELERQLEDPLTLRQALRRVEERERERGGKVTLATAIATVSSHSSGSSSSGSGGGGTADGGSSSPSSPSTFSHGVITTPSSSSSRRRGGSMEGGGQSRSSPSNFASEYSSATLISTPTSAAPSTPPTALTLSSQGGGGGTASSSPFAPPVSVLRVTFEDKVMKGGVEEDEEEVVGEDEVEGNNKGEDKFEEGEGEGEGEDEGEDGESRGGSSTLRRQHTSTERKMSVWTAFFENAARAKLGGGGGGDDGGDAAADATTTAASRSRGGISPANLALLQAVSAGDLAAVENILVLGGASCTTLLKCPTPGIPYPRLSLVVEEEAEEGGEGTHHHHHHTPSLSIKLDTMEGFSLSALHVAAALGHVGVLEVLGDAALMEREEEGGGVGGPKGEGGVTLDGGEGVAVGGRATTTISNSGSGGGGGEEEGEAAWPTTPSSTAGGGSGGGAEGGFARGGGLDVRDAQGATPLLLASSLALYHWRKGEHGAAEAFSRCVTHLLGSAADASTSSFTVTGVCLGHVIKGLERVGGGGGVGIGGGGDGGGGIPGAAELGSMLTEYSELVWRGSEGEDK